jgi:hypothetical protein
MTRAAAWTATPHLLAASLAFALGKTDARLEAQPLDRRADCEGTFDRRIWLLERHEEAVASGVDLVPTKTTDLAPDRRAVASEHLAPPLIAQLDGFAR